MVWLNPSNKLLVFFQLFLIFFLYNLSIEGGGRIPVSKWELYWINILGLKAETRFLQKTAAALLWLSRQAPHTHIALLVQCVCVAQGETVSKETRFARPLRHYPSKLLLRWQCSEGPDEGNPWSPLYGAWLQAESL